MEGRTGAAETLRLDGVICAGIGKERCVRAAICFAGAFLGGHGKSGHRGSLQNRP
jgi:hypothetical protein